MTTTPAASPAPAAPAGINTADIEMARAIVQDIERQLAEAKTKGVDVLPATLLFTAAMGGIQNERARAVDLLDRIGRNAAALMHRAGALETAARMAGQHGAGDQASSEKQFHMIGARTLMAAMAEIQRDPASCRACGGTKFVESKLSPGTRVSCDACAPPA